MISRTWHGRVRTVKADEYYEFLLRSGVPDYRSTPGNLGVIVNRRVDGDQAHFWLTTYWDSIESIKKFAGEQYERARYYPEDDQYLLEKEPGVSHAEVLLAEFPPMA